VVLNVVKGVGTRKRKLYIFGGIKNAPIFKTFRKKKGSGDTGLNVKGQKRNCSNNLRREGKNPK